jgi:hypothetical protein
VPIDAPNGKTLVHLLISAKTADNLVILDEFAVNEWVFWGGSAWVIFGLFDGDFARLISRFKTPVIGSVE